MRPATQHDNLGDFLKDRRARLTPAQFGFAAGRRRTAGLRREEVAMLADLSTTWYAWLEQNRPVRASADVLERLATAMRLDADEREHLFLLAHDRPPPRRGAAPPVISPRLRRLLDSMDRSPAYVFDGCWNVLAWNDAMSAVFADYGALPPAERNVLRQVFLNPAARSHMADWEGDARKILATFRGDLARHAPDPAADRLVADLQAGSTAFADWWQRRDVGGRGEGTKRLAHAVAGPVSLDYVYSTLDDAPGLGLLVFTARSATDQQRVDALVRRRL